jgi:septal ring factor EnvC (AmiA/AmiB activator)
MTAGEIKSISNSRFPSLPEKGKGLRPYRKMVFRDASRLFLVLIFSVLATASWAQKNKTQLQREKQKNIAKIKETERILDETSRKKKNSLGELTALNERIQQQESLISQIKNEVELLEQDIQENNGILTALEKDLAKLKEEFAAMLFEAQKANEGLTKLSFLFSAESFNQMLMRLKYMEQYSQARKEQAAAIAVVQDQLTDQVKEIEKKKAEKNTLLAEETNENNQLVSLKQKKRTVVRSLEKEEKSLRNDLEDTRKAIAKLDRLINDLVKEEMERAAREAKANTNTGKPSVSVVLSNDFEGNKNKFAWPVSGFISQKFGKQQHPVLPHVVIQNDGINIQTKEAEVVKSIFEGEVRRVAYIPAIGTSVIINHGDYFSVYTGLKDVYVKMGQKVGSRQDLGVVQANAEGISELRFQIRKNIVALNPEEWLGN